MVMFHSKISIFKFKSNFSQVFSQFALKGLSVVFKLKDLLMKTTYHKLACLPILHYLDYTNTWFKRSFQGCSGVILVRKLRIKRLRQIKNSKRLVSRLSTKLSSYFSMHFCFAFSLSLLSISIVPHFFFSFFNFFLLTQ